MSLLSLFLSIFLSVPPLFLSFPSLSLPLLLSLSSLSSLSVSQPLFLSLSLSLSLSLTVRGDHVQRVPVDGDAQRVTHGGRDEAEPEATSAPHNERLERDFRLRRARRVVVLPACSGNGDIWDGNCAQNFMRVLNRTAQKNIRIFGRLTKTMTMTLGASHEK